MIPIKACTTLIYLWMAIDSIWHDMPDPAILAAQVQVESCVSLTSSKCWSSFSELKTRREYGFGLGQVTIAYREDGSVRFNKWAELRKQFKKELNKWTWENRYDPELQLKAITLMMKDGYLKYKSAINEQQRLKFALAGYNGGDASILKDIGLCNLTAGCDSRYWDNNVEVHSTKSRKPIKMYGNRSAFSINREYPKTIFEQSNRYRKYTPINKILESALFATEEPINVCK